MALCPFAQHKLIAPGSNDPRITPTQATLHVAVSSARSLFGYFRDRSGGIESHFYIRWDGTIEQYRDTGWEADANYRANPHAVSIETQGFGAGKWTKKQLRSIKRLLQWLNAVHDIPLVRCPGPFEPGVGYHTMWGAPSDWTPVAKSCPGPNRIVQFNADLVPWMTSVTKPPAPPVRVTLSVVTANLWKDNRFKQQDLETLRNTRADIIGVQEGGRFIDGLKAMPGYQCLDETRPHGVQTLVRDTIEVLDHGGARISKPVGSSPGRHMTWVAYKFKGQLRAHINCHFNAGVQKSATKARNLPRVREYIKGIRVVAAKVKELEAAGYKVTISGDMNWAFSLGKLQWSFAPKVVFANLGYVSQLQAKSSPARPKGDRREVEYVFYRPDDLTIFTQRLVPNEHSDHPWPEVTFIVKGL